MAAHSTTRLANGGTLTVVEEPTLGSFGQHSFLVIERDELGSLVHAYPCDSLDQANAMVDERSPQPTASERIRAARESIEARRKAREADPVEALVAEGLRLAGVAELHRVKMLRELSDPDVKLQRGNAGAYCQVVGIVCGYVDALRRLGHDDAADRLAYVIDEPNEAN